ncbi:uncharacterized protein LOC121870361 isoform X2 [Homarus americanus]|nr:uncharacterized protein LOC121870361 isoform X2 [Homarus americanus]
MWSVRKGKKYVQDRLRNLYEKLQDVRRETGPYRDVVSGVSQTLRPWRVVATMVVLIFLFHLVSATTSVISPSRVMSVAFPLDLNDCLLKEITMNCSSTIYCAAICNHTPYCYFFCVSGNMCSLFSAAVLPSWIGYPKRNSLTFGKCFSTLYDERDIVEDFTNYVSPVTATGSDTNKVANGYFCSDTYYCFITNNDPSPLWSLYTSSSQTIVSVITIQSKTSPLNLTVYIGDTIDITQLPQAGPISPDSEGVVIFNLIPPAIGSFITIVGSAGVMNLCHVQVIIQ